jgi:hypothetical protein
MVSATSKELEIRAELTDLIFDFKGKDIKPSEEELKYMYSLCDKLEAINPRYGRGIGTYRQSVTLLVKKLPDGVMI